MTQARRRLFAVALTVGVIALLMVDTWVLLFPPARYLMIHADDAGLCSAVNQATIQAMEQGVVSSSSIMATCPGFEEIADYAIAHPEKDFGVHLVLTCDNTSFSWGPVLKEGISSLIQRDGSFWRTSEEVAANAKVEEVDRELRAQVRRTLDRGVPVTHLDHHMWVLLQRPDLLRIYVQLGQEFHLPIRLHRVFAPEECGAAMQNAKEYESLILPLVRGGNPMLDAIDASNYVVPPDQKMNYYLQAVRQIEAGVSEFLVHCSVNRPGMLLPGAADRRAADFQVVTSVEFRDEIQRRRITLVNWKDLMRLKKAGRI